MSLRHQLNLPRDPKSKLKNWFLTDIEKVIIECTYLNPAAEDEHMLLPGEKYYDVGQNTKAGSSISDTQHTQIWNGSTKSYKVYELENNPQFSKSINAFVDIVQVGTNVDAFYLKFKTKTPLNISLLEILTDLRIAFLKAFGGVRFVDFNFKAMADERGYYAIFLHPVCMLEKESEERVYNMDTKEFSDANEQYQGKPMPVHFVDTAKIRRIAGLGVDLTEVYRYGRSYLKGFFNTLEAFQGDRDLDGW